MEADMQAKEAVIIRRTQARVLDCECGRVFTLNSPYAKRCVCGIWWVMKYEGEDEFHITAERVVSYLRSKFQAENSF